MIDKELSYEELPVIVTDVFAILFPRDHGCHTRRLSRLYPSLDREGESVAVFGMYMLCDTFILKIPSLSSASPTHLLGLAEDVPQDCCICILKPISSVSLSR